MELTRQQARSRLALPWVTKPMPSDTSVKVKATALGVYLHMRNPGDVFQFDSGKASKADVERSSWMELVVETYKEPKPVSAKTEKS